MREGQLKLAHLRGQAASLCQRCRQLFLQRLGVGILVGELRRQHAVALLDRLQRFELLRLASTEFLSLLKSLARMGQFGYQARALLVQTGDFFLLDDDGLLRLA